MVDIADELLAFMTERHLATLTLVRPSGEPHVTPVGFSWDPVDGLARVITWNGSVKAALLARSGSLAAALCQVDGGRWITLHGSATVTADPTACAEGVERYARRYSQPKDRGADRRVIELHVAGALGRA